VRPLAGTVRQPIRPLYGSIRSYGSINVHQSIACHATWPCRPVLFPAALPEPLTSLPELPHAALPKRSLSCPMLRSPNCWNSLSSRLELPASKALFCIRLMPRLHPSLAPTRRHAPCALSTRRSHGNTVRTRLQAWVAHRKLMHLRVSSKLKALAHSSVPAYITYITL
jgi:hypothetical protein